MRDFIARLLGTVAAFTGGERPGELDCYVLAMSWSPTWCAVEGDARNVMRDCRAREALFDPVR